MEGLTHPELQIEKTPRKTPPRQPAPPQRPPLPVGSGPATVRGDTFQRKGSPSNSFFVGIERHGEAHAGTARKEKLTQKVTHPDLMQELAVCPF
jgi:hypothetical protein